MSRHAVSCEHFNVAVGGCKCADVHAKAARKRGPHLIFVEDFALDLAGPEHVLGEGLEHCLAAWFLGCLDRAFDLAESALADVFKKARFWEKHASTPLNDRQRNMLNRLLDGFEGNLTSSKWATIEANRNRPTAWPNEANRYRSAVRPNEPNRHGRRLGRTKPTGDMQGADRNSVAPAFAPCLAADRPAVPGICAVGEQKRRR